MNEKVLIVNSNSTQASAIAEYLRQNQHEVIVVEKDEKPSEKVCNIDFADWPKPQNRHERRKNAKLQRKKR